MSEVQKGLLALVAACTIWGLSPIFYKQLTHVPPLEILAHRTLWSFGFFTLVLLLQGRLSEVPRSLSSPKKVAMIAAAGLLISINWCGFILSVQIGRVVEASFGYYIFPLMAVSLGFSFLRERLSTFQWLAVFLAAAAVLVLGFGLGVPPWISLILATTFGFYGLIKKSLDVGPVVSVTTEVFLLLPVALIWIYGVNFAGWTGFSGRSGGFFATGWYDSLLLMFSGVLTGGPLIMFAYGAKRLRLATVGLIQYMNPTLQFLVAVVLFGEAFTGWHTIAFLLIWIALAVYSTASFVQDRSAHKASSRAVTEGKTVI